MTETMRIGFMPLADAAILIAAARCGFDARENLSIELCRETSWANVRDRLAIGQFDAAHLLAPMPVAAALRRGALDAPLAAPMALGLGGNTVTVSTDLWAELEATGLARAGNPAAMGEALKQIVAARRRRGAPRPVFAVVHAFSAHNYELRHWLAACGVAPDADVEIGVMAPTLCPQALASGAIDGFCAGEPWGTIAARQDAGRVILVKAQIWRASPEKVLGLRAEALARDPERALRLVRALLMAADWCARPENRGDLADMLAAPDALGVSAAALAPALGAGVRLADGSTAEGGIAFVSGAATFPWRSHARAFAQAMARWGQTRPTPDDLGRAEATYRPDLYRLAAAAIGVDAPLPDAQPETDEAEIEVAGTRGPMRVTRSRFFDEA